MSGGGARWPASTGDGRRRRSTEQEARRRRAKKARCVAHSEGALALVAGGLQAKNPFYKNCAPSPHRHEGLRGGPGLSQVASRKVYSLVSRMRSTRTVKTDALLVVEGTHCLVFDGSEDF